MKKFIDVTQLVHWPGKLTGIPRVMNELAVRYRRSDPEVVFVVWVKDLRSYCEIDLDQTLANRGQQIVYLHAGEVALPQSNSQTVLSGNTQAKKYQLRHMSTRVAKAGIRRTARVSKRLSATLEQRAHSLQIGQYKQIAPHKGNVLVVLWGEWWDPDFIAMLEGAHRDSGVKVVQVLYDMSPIVVPQFSNSGNATETFPVYCRRILPISNLVLSISENTRQDALHWLRANKLPEPPIKNFRLGDNIDIKNPIKTSDPAFRKAQLKGNDFILCVGTFELKKNHMLFYYVYKLAKARGIELPKLVIAGRRGWMTEPTYELMTKDPEVYDKFVFLHDESDEGLSWLYNNCMFTVLPSFYEGWGIPIAESVSRGVPCLCSNTSSMTEIAEGHVVHFSPASTDECLAGIQRWLNPKVLAAARKQAERYQPFSWDKSFKQVTNYLEEI